MCTTTILPIAIAILIAHQPSALQAGRSNVAIDSDAQSAAANTANDDRDGLILSMPQVALYATVSFMVVTVLGVFLYLTCSRRYRLNWFEQNLLETAREARRDAADTNEALLVGGPSASGGGCIPYNVDGGGGGNGGDTISLRSQHNRSPVSMGGGGGDDPTFWVPAHVQRQLNSAAAAADLESTTSLPGTPTSPTGSYASAAFSIASGQTGCGVPIARTDRHVVLAPHSPARPRVASMQAKLDPAKIDTSLYDNDNDRPVDLNPAEAEANFGMVHVSLNYDMIAGNLTVRLHEAENLQPRNFSGTADPYAKVRFLPDRQNRWQTRIHKRTLNPVFDEDFVFDQKPATINRHGVEILMYDFDAYSRHVCIGGTQIDLAHIDLTQGKVSMKLPLASCADQNADATKADLGDLMVSMSYLPSAERFTVIVMKARNLRVMDETRNSSDPYVKVSLWQNEKRLKKRKTSVYRNTLSPTYNEALQFDVGREQLKHAVFEFLVLHDSLLGERRAGLTLWRESMHKTINCPPFRFEHSVGTGVGRQFAGRWTG